MPTTPQNWKCTSSKIAYNNDARDYGNFDTKQMQEDVPQD